MLFSVSSMGARSDVSMALGITRNNDGQSTTARFCDIKQQRNCSYTVFVFWFDSNNKLNDLILLEKAHVILMTFLVKLQILYGTF